MVNYSKIHFENKQLGLTFPIKFSQPALIVIVNTILPPAKITTGHYLTLYVRMKLAIGVYNQQTRRCHLIFREDRS